MQDLTYHQIVLLITIFYGIVLSILLLGYIISLNNKNIVLSQKNKFTIIIPFRNEASNLKNILKDLEVQNYGERLDQIIFVDDHSEDNSLETLKNYRGPLAIELMELGSYENGKKNALSKAWNFSATGFCIQIDADVRLNKDWFQSITKELDDHTDMLVLPILFKPKSILQKLYCLEFMSVHAVTFAMLAYKVPIMINGANLVYNIDLTKGLKEDHEWNKTVSGDDMTLLHRTINSQGIIRYSLNPQLTNLTEAPATVKEFMQQRTRWIAKVGGDYSLISLVMALVFVLVNLFLIITLVMALIDSHKLADLRLLFSVKFIFDLLFILPSLIHFRKLNWIILYPILAILYPFYVLLVLLNSLSGKSEWKGRKIKVR